jgi:hypothetical protein
MPDLNQTFQFPVSQNHGGETMPLRPAKAKRKASEEPAAPHSSLARGASRRYSNPVKQPPVQPAAPPAIPVRLERYEDAPRPRKAWLHPTSALTILAIDWILFAEEVITFELALPLTCLLGFVSTFVAVYWIQRNKNQDSRGAAFGKALFGGFIAGLPTSIGGTVLATGVLMLAGLRGRSNPQPQAPGR